MEKMLCLFILFSSLASGILTQNSEEFSRRKDPFFSLYQVQGSWRQSQVSQPLGPCQPCQYMLQIYDEQIIFTIYSETRPNNVLEYSFTRKKEDFYQIFQKSSTMKQNGNTLTLKETPIDGYQYKFQVSIVSIGLYVKHTEIQNRYWLPFISIIFIVAAWLVYRLQSHFLKYFLQQSYKRSSLLASIFLAQLGTTICAYQGTLVIMYLLNFESYFGKIAAYAVFGTALLVTLIQTGYLFALIQKQLDQYFTQRQNTSNVYKLIVMLFIFVFGLAAYPLLLCAFYKGIWFCYFSVIGILVQYWHAVRKNIFPYDRFLLIYVVYVCYLAFLAHFYPILNFHQMSWISMMIFFAFLAGIYIAGKTILRKKVQDIRLSETSTVDKQDKKTSSGPGSTNFSYRTQQMIKSDIELDDRAI